MKKMLVISTVVVGLSVFQGFSCQTSHARTPSLQSSVIEIPVDGGVVQLEVSPDRGRPLCFAQTAAQRWRLRGAASDLIGKPYSIRLSNRTPHRVKIVVGVDGLNVYRRSPVVGRSDRDVGSILAPWVDRRLTGWQLDQSSAEQFVFSPSEWSEGQGRTDAQIGTIAVQVYLEHVQRWADDTDLYSREKKERGGRADGRCAPEAMPGIGTTSGDEISSRVRTVHFAASSTHPIAEVFIEYGGPSSLPAAERIFGMDLGRVRGGSAVLSIMPGSRAGEAGLQRGDVISRIDAEEAPDPGTVERILSLKRSGDRVFFYVRRGRHEIALKVRI